MRFRNLAGFGVALIIGAFCGSLIGPRPALAVAREIIELQRDVTTLLQGQKDMGTQITQDHTVMRTLIEQSNDTVGKLNGTMSGLQKSVQDVQANSGARLDTMSTQVQGLSDNLEEIKSRLGKLNQQLVDLQNTIQSLDAKISGGSAPTGSVPSSTPGSASARPLRIRRLSKVLWRHRPRLQRAVLSWRNRLLATPVLSSCHRIRQSTDQLSEKF